MTKDLNELKSKISRLGNFFYGQNKINWDDSQFSFEKAYVCSVISSIAYLELPEFELKHHDRVKLMPCRAYQDIVLNNIHVDVLSLLRESEFRDYFVVITDRVVAVGLVHSDVIFISLRGTRSESVTDWMTDFHARGTPAHVNNRPVSFHTGFYLHITECIEKIADEVNKRQSSPLLPVYVVGHSLGGAMAAILHALDNKYFSSHHRYGEEIIAPINTTSGYTYGMPRYGDIEVMYHLDSPYCIIHKNDLVPRVPPKALGYADAPYRYQLSDSGWLKFIRKNSWYPPRPSRHFMDNYVSMLGNTVGVS